MIDSIISHYRIVSELGRGGMGVVYKAEDTRLSRMVAIKVLPPHSVVEEDSQSRFGREAQAAAALNHPNIATVFEIDEEEGRPFIVMEFVDGPSLKDRIDDGPLKLDEAIKLGIQVASGLEAAHETGIVHRDIKPANVMLTTKGQAKIMDFGLAKLSDQTTLTKTGTTLGTVAYMSPEQARGEKVDHRSDIFALGVVIYEMIVGQMAFQGAYSEAVVYAILNVDPDPLTSLRTGVPMELERIVNKALAKNPNERYQGMSDMLVDLRAIEKVSTITDARAVSNSTKPNQTVIADRANVLPWIGIVAMFIVAIIAFWRPWGDTAESDGGLVRYIQPIPTDQTLASQGPVLALSDDGSKLVYAASVDGVSRLFLKTSDSFEAREVPGTSGASTPFFSPDGNWIGFFSVGKLKKVSVDGGSPQILCDADGIGGVWTEDGSIIFAGYLSFFLAAVEAEGGIPEPATAAKDLERGWYYHYWPEILPGNNTLLFTSWNGRDQTKVSARDLETGEVTTVIESGGFARYVPPGYLLFVRGADLMATRFNAEKLEVSGSAELVVEGIATSIFTAHYSVSKKGTLSYVPSGTEALERTLVWVNKQGEEEQTPLPTTEYHGVRVSPDGERVVYNAGTSIWVGDLNRGISQPVTDDLGTEFWPIWTPDGNHVIFNSDRYGGPYVNLYQTRADGGGTPERLTDTTFDEQPYSWTPDGALMALTAYERTEGTMDIMLLSMADSRPLEPLIQTDYTEFHPSFSPDGLRLAYASDRSGRTEVYIQSFPDGENQTLISVDGGQEPVWSPDGKTLYYRDATGDKIMSVQWLSGFENPPSLPEVLIEGEYHEGHIWGRNYDISPDGDRFLVVKERDPLSITHQINVILHLGEKLRTIGHQPE